MAHTAPVTTFLAGPTPFAQTPAAFRFELTSLVLSGPHVRRRARVFAPGFLSAVAHVIAVAAIIVLPLLLSEDVPPAPSDAVRAFFVPPAEVALPPPPPPPPPAGARVSKPAPAAPRPVEDAKFVAPIDVPDTVQPEEGIDLGVEGGMEGGVEGGVPGGVVGGVVGGLPSVVAPPPPAAPVRVGGMVRAPKLINRVTPKYPELALASRTRATLILEATVGVDGRVQEVRVLRGQPLFDPSAIEAVRQWRYQPLLLNGIPVPFIVSITLSFNVVTRG
jgi:protein TonB